MARPSWLRRSSEGLSTLTAYSPVTCPLLSELGFRGQPEPPLPPTAVQLVPNAEVGAQVLADEDEVQGARAAEGPRRNGGLR
jgi:hypothetical protein